MKSRYVYLGILGVVPLAFVVLWAGGALARSTGYAAQGNAAVCNSCHAGGAVPTVVLAGPTTVEPGATNTYTLTILVQAPPPVANQSPIAVLDGPYAAAVGEPVPMSGLASSDPDGTIVSFAWDFGDGSTIGGGPALAALTHSYAQAGTYSVTLTVTDDQGATGTATTTATIGGTTTTTTLPPTTTTTLPPTTTTTLPPTTTTTAPPPPPPLTGSALYATNCAVCHGAAALGTQVGPAIAGEEPGGIITTVRFGDGPMPAFGTVLDDEEIESIAAYVSSLPRGRDGHEDGREVTVPAPPDTGPGSSTTTTTTVPARSGAEIFAGFCAACHGADARGTGTAPSVAGEKAEKVRTVVVEGDGAMPSFATVLDSVEIDRVASWLAGLAEEGDGHEDGHEDGHGDGRGHGEPKP